MKNLPLEDRPYEKLEKKGAKSLSTSELLAIIIKSGTNKTKAIKMRLSIRFCFFVIKPPT